MADPIKTDSGHLTTSDGQRIAYDHYQAGHDKLVVIVHGFYNSKDAVLIRRLKDELIGAYDVFIFDLRGHGKSSGLFTWTSRENIDLETALEHIRGRYAKIGVIGFSYGAAVSIRVIAERGGVDSFIAVSAPVSARVDYRLWELDFENDILYNLGEGGRNKGIRPGAFWLDKKRPIDLAEKMNCPVFYIHGERDWVTRCTHSQRLFEKTRAKKKITIIKDGPHAEYLMRKEEDGFVGMIKDWFAETL